MTLHNQLYLPKNLFRRPKPVIPKILLVDDYEANILVAGTCLECLGLSYDTAINGLDAVQQVIARQYTVILMDINMPEMDGISATELIRKLEKDSLRLRQPIIAMTAHPDFLEDGKAQLFGMDAVIMKPFHLLDLEKLLQKYIIQ